MRIQFIIYCLIFQPFTLFAADYPCFTEPNRTIALAAPEADILVTLTVQEGQIVQKGDIVATLDNSVLETALAVAKARKNATGRLKSAQAIARLQQEKLNRLMPLLARGSAQQHEVTEAKIALESAQAEVQAARDVINENSLEYKHLQAKIARRQLRSSLTGVVTEIHRQPAEFVGGNQVDIMTIASLDPLQVTLYLPTVEALRLTSQDTVQVQFPGLDFPTQNAKIVFISPVTEADSDTVKIRAQFANPEQQLRSGVKCVLVTQTESSIIE